MSGLGRGRGATLPAWLMHGNSAGPRPPGPPGPPPGPPGSAPAAPGSSVRDRSPPDMDLESMAELEEQANRTMLQQQEQDLQQQLAQSRCENICAVLS